MSFVLRHLVFVLSIAPGLVCAAEPAASVGAATAEPPEAPTSANAAPAAKGSGGVAAEAIVVTDREAEYAKIAPRLAPGDELLWLDAGDHKFVAFVRKPRQGPSRGAMLIVPAPQELLDQRELIRSLRTLPPAGGFVTLALQPPLASSEAAAGTKDEAAVAPAPDGAPDVATPDPAQAVPAAAAPAGFCPRVEAALRALEAALAPPPAGATAPSPITIVAADGSVTAVLGCYAAGLPARVGAFAAIGRWTGDVGALTVPSIEFVPLRDPVAVKAADARAALPLAMAAPHRRVDLDGVDARLDGAGEDVAKRLRGWLEHLPPPDVAKGNAAAAAAAPNVSS